MLYHPDLRTTQLVVGLVLLIMHLFAWFSLKTLPVFLKAFPRSKSWGFFLLSIAAGWSLWLMISMDLGEFTNKRPLLIGVVPIAYLLTLFFVDEFLAVRALGMVYLLISCVVLDAAYLSDDPARLPLVVLAYAWIVAALFMVGKPYLLRDAIEWAISRPARLKLAATLGIGCGILLIAIAAIRFS